MVNNIAMLVSDFKAFLPLPPTDKPTLDKPTLTCLPPLFLPLPNDKPLNDCPPLLVPCDPLKANKA